MAVSASGGDTPDPGDTRDSLRFGPSSNLSQDDFRLSGPNNPAENFFASQINGDDGKLNTRGTFGDRNNDFKGKFDGGRQGWDITNVDASPQLTTLQTEAFAQGTADADDFFINALAMQIDVVAPGFWDANNPTSVNRSTAEVGDVLTYTVELDNRSGFTAANDVVLTVPLPAGMSFVAGSFRLDGTATGANPITGAADWHRGSRDASRGDVPASGGFHSSCAGARSIPGHADVDVHVRGLRRPDTAVGLFDLEHGDHRDCAHHRHQISLGTIDSAGGDPDVHDHDLELRHGAKRRALSSPTQFQPVQPIGPIRQRSTEPRSLTSSGTSPLVVGMQVNSPGAPTGIVLPGESAVVTFRVRRQFVDDEPPS